MEFIIQICSRDVGMTNECYFLHRVTAIFKKSVNFSDCFVQVVLPREKRRHINTSSREHSSKYIDGVVHHGVDFSR